MKQSRQEAFIAAYDEHADAIFRFCYAQAGNRDVALDLMQDTFARTWRHMADGRTIGDMRPFLYRTARNALIDHWRRGRTQSLDTMRDDGFDVADERTPDPLLSTTVAHTIRLAGQLEQPYREVVLMRYVDDLKPREIAQLTGESENVISVRITRGVQKLRELLKP